MARNKDQNEDVIVDVGEVYSKTETFIDDNKNSLIGVVVVIAVIIGGYFGYKNYYLAPLEEEAVRELFMAQKYWEMDSLDRAIDGNINFKGLIEIADDYSATKAGNLANYYLGIAFLKTGEFQDALDALNRFDGNDEMLGSQALGNMGDALLELGDKSKAASYYEKAANRKENQFLSPLFLKKAAMTYELLNDNEKAIELYTRIKKDYRNSAEAGDIEKYIARAEAKL